MKQIRQITLMDEFIAGEPLLDWFNLNDSGNYRYDHEGD
jgi:hypothetical protein